MDKKYKNMVFESYMACMENRATDEQQLIWKLGNALHCVRVRLANGDMEEVNKILYEQDYTIREQDLLEDLRMEQQEQM